ncbi:MAG: hypothetical protein RLZZ127_1717, partial [Planctomycetota bacterium]
MSAMPYTVYCNWAAYDELSEPTERVGLDEALALRQLAAVQRLRAGGVRIDAYLMDCFWYAQDGGYRRWCPQRFPEGGGRWIAACHAAGLAPGLWFGLNSLGTSCVSDPAWAPSLAASGNASLSAGPFLAHVLESLERWWDEGIRVFKFDFADLDAGTPDQVATMLPSELRAANAAALRGGLAAFRRRHPGCRLLAYNGLEEGYLQAGTGLPFRRSLDLRWMECFDTVYTGDPRPADIPAWDFWRSKDVYSDHMVRTYHAQGWPLDRLDNAGFMVGTTATCYRRGTAGWRAMLLLSMARGGAIDVLYGDLALLDDADAAWWAAAQARYDRLRCAGIVAPVGGMPGAGVPYGWSAVAGGDGLWAVVNPGQRAAELRLPGAAGAVEVFRDGGAAVGLRADGGDLVVALAPEQMALL